jgi:hypothetical protein
VALGHVLLRAVKTHCNTSNTKSIIKITNFHFSIAFQQLDLDKKKATNEYALGFIFSFF